MWDLVAFGLEVIDGSIECIIQTETLFLCFPKSPYLH